jgi:heme-degrading monooxygenase HmoA
MTVLRIDRFTVEPDNAAELLTRRAALVAAVRGTVPGLLEARLAKVDDRTWVDMWRWDSLENAHAAVTRAQAGAYPEAAAAFELTRDVVTEFTEIVDER